MCVLTEPVAFKLHPNFFFFFTVKRKCKQEVGQSCQSPQISVIFSRSENRVSELSSVKSTPDITGPVMSQIMSVVTPKVKWKRRCGIRLVCVFRIKWTCSSWENNCGMFVGLLSATQVQPRERNLFYQNQKNMLIKKINNSLILNTLVWRRWQPDWSSSDGWPQVTWKVTDERSKKNKVVHHSVNVVVASLVTDLCRPKDAPSPADGQGHGDGHQVHQQEIPQHWLQRKHCKLDWARSSTQLQWLICEMYFHAALVVIIKWVMLINETQMIWRSLTSGIWKRINAYHLWVILLDERWKCICISVTAKSDQHPAAEIRSDGSHSKLLRLLPRRDRVQGDRLYIDTSDTLYPDMNP